MRYIIFLLFLIGISPSSYTQDSLKIVQNKVLIDSLKKIGANDEALILAKRSVEIAENGVPEIMKGEALLDVGNLFYRKRLNDSATIYASKALEVASNAKDPELLSRAFLLKGNVHFVKFEDHQAIEQYEKIDSVCEEYGIQNRLLVRALSNIGKLLIRGYTMNDTSYTYRAEKYIQKSIQIAESIDLDGDVYRGYTYLAEVMRLKEDYREAASYLEKSYAYFKENESVQDLSDVCWTLGNVYVSLGEVEKGRLYYNELYDIMINTNDEYSIGRGNWIFAGFLQSIDRCEEAIPYYQKALKYFKNMTADEVGVIFGATYDMAGCYKDIGKFEESTRYYVEAITLKDSLEAKMQRSMTLDFEKKYETEKKQQEIELLTVQNNLANQRSRTQLYIFVGIGTLILLAAVFLFILYRNRQKTATKLRELDKIKSNFFANISHEFRTPLTLIKSPVEAKLSNGNLQPEDRGQYESINRNADRLLCLVDQLLDLSRLEAGSMKLNVEEASLGSFLEASLASFEYIAIQKKITYHHDFNCKEEGHWFDKDVIEKITVNLVSNAFKYTPDNGDISCLLTCTEGRAMMSVSNTGESIDNEELTKLFERFYQADSGKDGVGIGLALVKELVTLHHGRIYFNSGDGQTDFSVEIPIDRSAYSNEELRTVPVRQKKDYLPIQDADTTDIEDPTILSDNPILLVVEDNSEVRKLVSDLFKELYTVIEAENGEEGIEKAIQYIPDIIVSDVMMPKKDGIELSATLKSDERTSHIPIILLTAKAGEENVVTGLETGADDYLIKPFSNNVLKIRVKKLIELRAQLRLRYSQEVILRPKDIAINSADEKFLERVQVLLDDRLTDPDFNAEQFSKELRMSRMQLHRKLKALVGLTTTEFIRSQRLKLATYLLENSDINMSVVGYSVGFNDPSYFSKCFKEAYGCTPTQYATDHKPSS